MDEIGVQAQNQGSLNIAITGLNSIRQPVNGLARLAGHLLPASAQVNITDQTNVDAGAGQVAERLIQELDSNPKLKAQIAQILMEESHDKSLVKLPIAWIRSCGQTKFLVSLRTSGKIHFCVQLAASQSLC